MAKNKEITSDDLAMMVQKGFQGIEKNVSDIKNDLKLLERGQEDIKLRLDNVPYCFEMKEQEDKLQKHDRRIGTLERKVFAAR